jgi:hypothetical protein
MFFKVICEDSRQQDGEAHDTRSSAESFIANTSYPSSRWVEKITDICGWCGNDCNLEQADGSVKVVRESDGCCAFCGAL